MSHYCDSGGIYTYIYVNYTLTTTLINLDNNYNSIKQSNFKFFETSITWSIIDNTTTAVESGTVY